MAFLSSHGVPHSVHRYEYVAGGGAAASSAALRLRPLHVLKTLVFDDRHTQTPFVVIQHGPLLVDVRKVAAETGRKKGSVVICAVDKAEQWSGYQVGGTSPFALAHPTTVYLERSVAQLRGAAEEGGDETADDAAVFINGGGRGLLVRMTVSALLAALHPTLIDVTKDG